MRKAPGVCTAQWASPLLTRRNTIVSYGSESREEGSALGARVPRIYGVITSQWRYRALHRFGIVHEYEFKALPMLTDRSDPLVLDIGGNNGQSILSIRTVLPSARVVTFEPARRHRESLRALAGAARRRDDRAVCARPGRRRSRSVLACLNGMPMHALASLDRGEAENWLGPESIYGFDPDLQSMDRERVVMRRLDGLELDPDMIKIDVQGTEPDVIEGVSRRFGERGLRSWPRPSRPVGRPWSCSSRSATASTHSARAPSSPGRIPRRQITF